MVRLKVLAENSTLAVVYVCLGVFSSWASPTHGYADSVWLPAGLALGTVLARGNSLLPGVLAGSFASGFCFLEVRAGWASSIGILNVSLVMAFASVVQAWFSAKLIGRFVGAPLSLASVSSVVWFLLIAGPLGCLPSATISVGSLLAGGFITPHDFGMTWLTWWAGDAIGAIGLTPVVLAFLSSPRQCHVVHGRAVILYILASLAMIIGGFGLAMDLEQANIVNNLKVEADASHVEIEDGIREYFRVVEAFRAFDARTSERGIEGRPSTSGDRSFSAFAESVTSQLPGALGFAWVPGVATGGKLGEIRGIQPQARTEFFKEVLSRLGPEVWTKATLFALAENSAVGTQLVKLDASPDGGYGFFLVAPVASAAWKPDPRAGARSDPGFIVALVSVEAMMHHIFRDVTKLESTGLIILGPEGEVLFKFNANQGSRISLQPEVRRVIPAPGIQWTAQFIASPQYLLRFSQWHPASIMLVGLLFIMMAVGFVLFMVGQGQVMTRLMAEREHVWTDLGKTESRKAAALEASLDAIIGMDKEGNIIDFNKSAEKIFGHKAPEVIGKQLGEILIPERYRKAHYTGMKRYLESGVGPVLGVTLEVSALRADGTEFPIELQVVAVESGGEPSFTGVVRDISLRKNLEEGLREAKEAAEAANAAKSQFLANMSHEIRTPLGAVIGFAELMAHPDLKPGDRESYLDAIRRNGALLANVINDILDLSKVEAGRLDIETRPTDFRRALRDVEMLLAIQAKEKGIVLRFHCDEDVPGTVFTDPVRLHQILLNIVGNAVKFTRQGEVDVSARMAGGPSGDRKIAVAVRDTGPGLTRENIERIFRPFGQADLSTTRKFGGTGLGLVLAKRLAGLLDGDVQLTTTAPGKGSVFTITFAIDAGASRLKVS